MTRCRYPLQAGLVFGGKLGFSSQSRLQRTPLPAVGGAASLVRRGAAEPPLSYAVDENSDERLDVSVLEISRFLDIVIGIFPRDHLPPHFHAVYGEYQITVGIQSGVVSGDFPKRALELVLEWLDLHREAFLEDWHLVQAGRPANKIAPLE